MAKSYYEAHITMEGLPSEVRPAVEKLKWKFSCISGDPTLGDGIKCYATKHFKESRDREEVLEELKNTARKLHTSTCKVIRRKIELVIFDDRSETVRFNCNGVCPECKDEWKECKGCRGSYLGVNCPFCDGTLLKQPLL